MYKLGKKTFSAPRRQVTGGTNDQNKVIRFLSLQDTSETQFIFTECKQVVYDHFSNH